jgi:maltooligosyltrehalose synthase
MNSLSQLVLKSCLPGVPDFYQGTELWDFTLVDPDNRRQVDFSIRQKLLRELRKQFNDDPRRLANDLMSSWPDTRIKLFATWRLMQLRREHSDLFKFGRYLPLNVEGTLSQHLVAFARHLNSESAIVIVPRLVQNVHNDGVAGVEALRAPSAAELSLPSASATLTDYSNVKNALSELTIELPPDFGSSYVNVFTDESLHIDLKSSAPAAACGCFAPLPFTVLMST